MNARTREDLTNTKKIFEILGMRYIENTDKRIIDHVSNLLSKIKTNAYVSIGTVSIHSALETALKNIEELGLEPSKETISIIKGIELKQIMKDPRGYTNYIVYSVDDNTHQVDKNSGTLEHYKVPIAPDIMSPLLLGHESIHAMKDTNYEEYIDGQIIGDVIPILYELLMCDKYPELRDLIINFRITSLIEDRLHYENAIKQMKKSKSDKDLYKVVASRSGQYLNSFYYALQLYNIYKSNPKDVLEAVQCVLRHEITTRELLEIFGLFRIKNFDTFNNELEELTKTLHK